MMERNQLRYVVETAKAGNVTRAAENLHLTQPSLSNQIIALERELGIRLFERSRKSIHLTEAGKSFVYQAEKILNEFNELTGTMHEFANLNSGTLTIGLLSIAFQIGIIDMISDFSEEFPGIRIQILEQGSHALMESLKKGECDVVFAIVLEKTDEKVQYINVEDSELGVIVPLTSDLSKKQIITTKDLTDQNLILSSDSFALHRIIERRLQEDGIHYYINAVFNQIETCFSLASRNFGITFSTRQFADYYHHDNLTYIPLAEMPTREVSMAYTKAPEYHPALNAFVEYISDCLQEKNKLKGPCV